MIWEVITGKTPSPYNPLTVEPSWSVAQLLQGGGSSDHDGALAADKDRRCTATQLKDGLAIARNAEPKPQASDLLTVGADSCDEMLRGLEGLGGSRTIDTVDATPPDTMGTSTVELVRQLVALRKLNVCQAPTSRSLPPLFLFIWPTLWHRARHTTARAHAERAAHAPCVHLREMRLGSSNKRNLPALAPSRFAQ